jgi:hypothetical protein
LREIYKGYIDITQGANFTINISTPTWRANRERVLGADIKKDINEDAVRFLNEVRDEWEDFSSKILIGGFIGCKNDCYKPQEGLQPDNASSFF